MNYELIIIGSPESQNLHENTEKAIKEAGGKVVAVNKLGERAMTYKIKGSSTGVYVSFDIEINPEKTPEFRQLLGFEEEILRSMLLERQE